MVATASRSIAFDPPTAEERRNIRRLSRRFEHNSLIAIGMLAGIGLETSKALADGSIDMQEMLNRVQAAKLIDELRWGHTQARKKIKLNETLDRIAASKK